MIRLTATKGEPPWLLGRWLALPAAWLVLTMSALPAPTAGRLPRVRVSPGAEGFRLSDGRPFVPAGFNYDHDESGRLIEDYWEREWDRVEQDFREMRELGATVVRIHLQFGRFMPSPGRPDRAALRRLKKLAELAERERLYLDLTGLGCYHKRDVPAWYDALDEKARWAAQAEFWEAVAREVRSSPAIFCYDLMNEPVVSGGRRPAGDWLGPAFAGKHFVQFITLDPAGREAPAVAVEWIRTLKQAIRRHDRERPITVGLVDWSLDRPGLRSGFVPARVAPELDFVAVHLYPQAGKVPEALETLRAFRVEKPVVIEETFPLGCGMPEFERFLRESRGIASGWIGFYWGRTPAELRGSQSPGDVLTLAWLELFNRLQKEEAKEKK